MKRTTGITVLAAGLTAALWMGMSSGVMAEGTVSMECIKGTEGANSKEGPENLFDRDLATKWCVSSFSEAYVIWKASEPVSPTGYKIATGNDSSTFTGRNPRTWYLFGSNDSGAENDEDVWTLITKTEDDAALKDEDKMTIEIDFSNAASEYQYYKLCITENQGADCMQISEFELTYDGDEVELFDSESENMEVWTSDGNTYTGTRVNGVITGIGKCVYENGDIYIGQWENGMRNGAGRHLDVSSNETFEGQFADGDFEYFVSNSDAGKWIGPSFRDDVDWHIWIDNDQWMKISQYSKVNGKSVKDGLSVSFNADKSVYTCTWYEKGEEVSSSPESRTSENGNKYTGFFETTSAITGTLAKEYNTEDGVEYCFGTFTEGSLNGQCVILHANGDVFYGEFQNGTAEGEGMRYNVNTGNWYIGSYHNGFKDGDGILYEDGTFYEVTYDADQNGKIVSQQALDIGDFDQSSAETSEEDTAIVWQDEGMEAYIRAALDRPDGDITGADLSDIKALRVGTYEDGVKAWISKNTATDPGNLSNNEEVAADSSLEGVEIHSLADLVWMPNLKILQIQDEKLTDISALSSLVNLEKLYLNDTGITDISVLTSLSNLKLLYMRNTGITDISVLSSLVDLEELSLSYTGITDISALASLTNLKALYLYDTDITDISVLSSLVDLERLGLSYTGITDISALASLTNLKELYMNHTDITDISVLGGLTNLEKVGVSDCPGITDFGVLDNLPNLTDRWK